MRLVLNLPAGILTWELSICMGLRIMSKRIGYLPKQHGLVLLGEDADGGATAAFDIPAGLASVEFHFINVHPATDNAHFVFQVDAVGGSGFNETMTTTWWWTGHEESDGSTFYQYGDGYDQAQGTAYQNLAVDVGNGGDESVSGILTLYDPSSPTYVKHFASRIAHYHSADYSIEQFAAGYINTTTAIDAISFKFDSGNIDAGIIRMYGVR